MRPTRYLGLLLLSLLLASACGADDDGIAFEGTLGERVPLTLTNWVPRIEVELGGNKGLGLVDTGAPLSIAYGGLFPQLALDTRSRVEGRAFGVRFPEMPLAVIGGGDGTSECSEPQHGVILGQDLLGHFHLNIDYREKRASLDSDGPAGEGDIVAAARLGGGAVPLEGDLVPVGATRIVVEVTVEGRKLNALIDTGASLSVISKRVIDDLALADRPQLCCSSISLFGGIVDARTVRLRELTIGKHTVKNVAALMLPNEDLLEQLSLETGRAIDMILGATPLRRFAVDIDMRAPALRLSPYPDTSHVSPDEYVLPGFSICKSTEADGAVRVVDVYEGTDAKRLGIFAGTLVVEVNGQSVKDLDAEQVLALIRKTAVGQTVKLTFRSRTNGTRSERDIVVERVLPDFE